MGCPRERYQKVKAARPCKIYCPSPGQQTSLWLLVRSSKALLMGPDPKKTAHSDRGLEL